MKNEKLLTVLIIAALILSIVSTVVSIMSLRRIKMHDDLLQAMQVLVYADKLAEDVAQENVIPTEPEAATAAVAQGQEQPTNAQQVDAQKPNAQQAEVEDQKTDANKPAHKHPNKTNRSAESKESEPTLHDQLLKIIAGESYVDLGLPSGTLWKAENEEGLMDYKTAKKQFKKRIPSISQWEELCKYCEWSWTGNGYDVIGPNGVAIFIPAAGYRNASGQTGKVGEFGTYWSSTIKNREEAWRFGFESDKFSMATHSRRYGRSIRLVYKPIIRDDGGE